MTWPMYDMPDHMIVPVDRAGDGPVPEADAFGSVCSCGCPHSKSDEVQR